MKKRSRPASEVEKKYWVWRTAAKAFSLDSKQCALSPSKKKKKRKAWRDGGILKLPAGRTQTRPLGWWNKVERNKHTQNQNQKPAADYCWRARRQEATDSVLSGTKPKCKLAWGLVLQVTASHRCGLVSSLCHMCLSPFRCSLQVSACWLRFSGPWCQCWFRVIRMPLYHRPYAHSYKWFCFS